MKPATRKTTTFGFGIAALAVGMLLLGGCGGRGGDSGNNDNADKNDEQSNVADIRLVTSSPSLSTGSDSSVTLTAIVRDGDNNALKGQDVQFTSDSGTIRVQEGTTNDAGQATAELSTTGNPENRTIMVTAKTDERKENTPVEVTGTTLSLDGFGSLADGDSGEYTATLLDSEGTPVTGETVMIDSKQGNPLKQSDPKTNQSGKATFKLTADNSSDDILSASALGETASLDVSVSDNKIKFTQPDADEEFKLRTKKTVKVKVTGSNSPLSGENVDFSSTRGKFPDGASQSTDGSGIASVKIRSDNAGPATITAKTSEATITRDIEFVATDPDTIDVDANPSQVPTNDKATITAVVRDPSNNLVKGEQIDFNLSDDTSGGALKQSTATTDSQGRASVVYQSTDTSTGANAITITAKVDSDQSINSNTELTVGNEAVNITLGTGNKIESPTETRYELPYTVQVTDASGRPVTGKDVNLTLVTWEYKKGSWQENSDGYEAHINATCDNEDRKTDDPKKRFNGILDDKEDFNDNGELDIPNAAGVSPGTLTTDNTGFADFVVAYPKENARWAKVRLTAEVQTSGTEGTRSTRFSLGVSTEDTKDEDKLPGGKESRYGTNSSCTTEG